MPSVGAHLRPLFGDRGWIIILMSIFIFMTAKDFLTPRTSSSPRKSADYLHSGAGPDPSVVSNDDVYMPAKKATMRFYYCISCGYAKAYQEYANFIRQNFPDIDVQGENYSPGAIKTLIANVLNFGRMAVLFLVMMNKNPFPYFNYPTPSLWYWLMQHKIPGCLLIFFLTNAIEAQLMSSGAFEIYYGNSRIWSKLETGRVPSHEEMFRLIAIKHRPLAMDKNLGMNIIESEV